MDSSIPRHVFPGVNEGRLEQVASQGYTVSEACLRRTGKLWPRQAGQAMSSKPVSSALPLFLFWLLPQAPAVFRPCLGFCQ